MLQQNLNNNKINHSIKNLINKETNKTKYPPVEEYAKVIFLRT